MISFAGLNSVYPTRPTQKNTTDIEPWLTAELLRFRMNWPHLSQRYLVPAVTCLIGAALGSSTALGNSPTHSPYRNLSVFARALAHLELSYVDPVDQDALIEGAIEGMAGALDPHTAYLPAERYQRLMEDTEGQYGGIGVEILARDGWLTITSIFDGSPAATAGLKSGDRILSIDKIPARDMRMTDALDRVRGRIGTSVELGIVRVVDGDRKQLRKLVTRQAIQIDVVSVSKEQGVVIIRIAAFADKTAEHLEAALARAAADPQSEAVVIDLRGNAGGLLDQAARSADLLLSQGTIVTTRGRGGAVLANYRADSHRLTLNKPLFVWVDAFTASAAEILAAALQEGRVGLVIGHRTWGKGSVQNIIELPDGSALKVTVARYFSGSGRSIQALGIAPDIMLARPEDAPSERELPRHLEQGSRIKLEQAELHSPPWSKPRRRAALTQKANCKQQGIDHAACTRMILGALAKG